MCPKVLARCCVLNPRSSNGVNATSIGFAVTIITVYAAVRTIDASASASMQAWLCVGPPF
jgi:hypothetical protein